MYIPHVAVRVDDVHVCRHTVSHLVPGRFYQ